MKSRVALGITLALGVLVLIPVLTVIGLGLYGSSLGGTSQTVGASGAQLKLFPGRGLPGSNLKVLGSDWPPRAEVSVFMTRPDSGNGASPPRLRLAEIITSRRGGFEFETLVPASLIPGGTPEVLIQVEQKPVGEDSPTILTASFGIDPYPNSVNVRAIDSATGQAAANAVVEIQDGFGQRIAKATTGAEGLASFAAIAPGKLSVSVRKVDYKAGEAGLEVAGAGVSELTVALVISPGRRLYVSGAVSAEDGTVKVVGIDRASGLPVEDRLPVPAGQHAPTSDRGRGVYQGFILPIDINPQTAEVGGAHIEAFWAMGAIARSMRNRGSGYLSSVWHTYIGRSAVGDVLFARTSAQIFDPVTHLYVAEPGTGKLIIHKELDRNVLTPVLLADGKQIVVVNWVTASVDILDIASGTRVKEFGDAPYLTVQALLDPRDSAKLLLYSAEGGVYRMDLATGALTGPVMDVRGAFWIEQTRDGRLMTVGGKWPQLALMNPDSGSAEAIIPLEQPAEWVWTDPEGPFIFVVDLMQSYTVTIQLLDSATYKLVGVERFPIFPA